MKIRTGFVSNSSSSSFCLVGANIDEYGGEIEKLAKKFGLEYNKNDDEYWENMERVQFHLEKLGFDVFMGEENIRFGKSVKTNTPIDYQIVECQKEFDKLGINKIVFFEYGETYS